MVQVIPEDIEEEGRWYRWNVRKNKYELDTYKNAYLNKKKATKTNRDYGRAIAGVILLQPEAVSGLIEGITGAGTGNFDRLFISTSKMTDEEIGLGVGMLVAYTTAGQVGARFGYRKTPSVKEIKASPKFKEVFPKNDINLDSAILTYKNYYENAGDLGRARLNSNAVELQQAKLKAKFDKAVQEKDTKAIEKAQKEIDEFGNAEYSTAKREYKEQELKMEKMERLENEAITEGERESVLQTLRDQTGNDAPRSDWMALYRLRFKKNPTREELYDFQLSELKEQADTGNAPTIIGEWYTRYGGGNEEGVSTDLQELGRRVMSMLDGGDGVLDEPSGQFLMENFSGAEREALETAYNNPSIWNKLKADYKTFVAGTAALAGVGAGVGAIASQDTNEITVEGDEAKDIDEIIEEEEKKDGDEMDLVESTDRPEQFIKKGEDEEVVVKPDGSTEIIDETEGLEEAEEELDVEPDEEIEVIDEEEGLEEAEKELDVDPNDEKEKGKDRLVPSGEPDIEEIDISTNPDDTQRKGVDTIIQDSDAKQTAPPLVKPQETLGPPPTNVSRNFSELIKLSALISQEVYNPDQFINDTNTIRLNFQTPVLIRRQRGKLFIAVRGSKTLANWISNLTIYSPVLGANQLSYYKQFNLINEKIETRFHAGFLEVITFSQTSTRLGQQSLNNSFIPLYDTIRREIDNQRSVVNEVIFTGHSLGGAIASILYYLYQNDINRISKKVAHARAITFGAPRFVLRGYEDGYNSSCPNLFRCWNYKDIVPYTPLYDPIDGFGFLSGFIHVGRALCLDKPTRKTTNINEYTTDIIKQNEPLKIALKGSNIEDGKKMRDLITSKPYQEGLIGSMLTALGNVEMKDNIGENVIYSMEGNLKKDVEEADTWVSKCEVLGDCGFEEYLKQQPIGEDPVQQNYSVLGIFGSVFRQLTIKDHDIGKYIENIDNIISKEVEENTSFLYRDELEADESEEILKAKEEILKPTEKDIEDELKIETDEVVGFTLETIKEDELLVISY